MPTMARGDPQPVKEKVPVQAPKVAGGCQIRRLPRGLLRVLPPPLVGILMLLPPVLPLLSLRGPPIRGGASQLRAEEAVLPEAA